MRPFAAVQTVYGKLLSCPDWNIVGRLPVAGPVQIPNCIEVRLMWAEGSRRMANVLHGNLTAAGPLAPTLPETLFQAIKSASSTTAWLAHIAPAVELAGVGVKDLRQMYQVEYVSTGLPAPGTAADAALPLQSALVVTLRTAQSGQGFRGRAYMPGLTIGSLADPRTFNDTVSSAAKAFIDGVNSVMSTNGFPMVVAQRALQAGTHHDGSPWPARSAQVVPVVSTDIANKRVDTQRRRLGR